MERHVLPIALALTLLLAGCIGSSPGGTPATGGEGTPAAGGTPTPTTTTDGPRTATDNCPPPGNFSERALPDPPANLTRTSAAAFVAEYEENLTWNRMLTDDLISLGVHVSRTSVINETPTGYVVHVEGGLGFERCLDGGHVAGDGFISANYFVTETTLVRLDDPRTDTADPRNGGTVVERWGERDRGS